MDSQHAELELAEAARAYVAARRRADDADSSALLRALVELDAAWHELHQAAGETWPGCCE